MAIRAQIGIEAFDDEGKRILRLTPVNKELDGGNFEDLALLAFSAIDATDLHKGDGEIDIPIKDSTIDALEGILGPFKNFLAGNKDKKANVFLRLTRAA